MKKKVFYNSLTPPHMFCYYKGAHKETANHILMFFTTSECNCVLFCTKFKQNNFCFSGKEALCIINVKNIKAVEKLDESAFNRKNVSQFPSGAQSSLLKYGPFCNDNFSPRASSQS